MEGHALEKCLQDLALGMGGQSGGMVNEAGHFPEVCKKSLQAMVADMQGAVAPSSSRPMPWRNWSVSAHASWKTAAD